MAAALAVVLSVQLAVAVPAESVLLDTGVEVALDYTALPDAVSPLSASYIAQVLGRPVPGASPEVPAEPVALDRAAPLPSPAAGVMPPLPSPRAASSTVVATSNDDIRAAREIDDLPFTEAFSASTSTRQAADPDDCVPAGGTRWFRWTAHADTLVVATTAASFVAPSTLGVFAGSSPTDLTAVDCRTGVLGTRLPLTTRTGTTYWFQLTVPAGAGDVTFALDELGVAVELIAPRPSRSHVEADCVGCSRGRPVFVAQDTRLSSPDVAADASTVVFRTRIPYDPRDDDHRGDIYALDLTRADARPELITVSHDGRSSGDRDASYEPEISADGRFVVFSSAATNLVEDDTNDAIDNFIHDRATGVTERVSVWTDGAQGVADPELLWLAHGDAGDAHMDVSADGSVVVFMTALRLHDDDLPSNGAPHPHGVGRPNTITEMDVYVRDRRAGTTRLLTDYIDGPAPDRWYDLYLPSISGDGRMVAFSTDAPLTADDPHADDADLYALDLRTGEVRLVTRSVVPDEATTTLSRPVLSHDGRWLAFESEHPGLVEGDSNNAVDVFRADLHHPTGDVQVIRVSVGSDGAEVVPSGEVAGTGRRYGNVSGVQISDDGRFVAFPTPLALSPDDHPRPQAHNGLRTWDDDVYLFDAWTGITTLMSVAADGSPAQEGTSWVGMSADAAVIVMASQADLSGDGRANPAPDPVARETHGSGAGLYARLLPR